MKMRQKGKRVLTALLAMLMVITMIPAQKVKAENYTNISVNKAVTTTFSTNKYDQKVIYHFKAPKNGFFRVDFNLLQYQGNDSAGQYLNVYDSNGKKILDYTYVSSSQPSASSDIFASKAGQTFIIIVESYGVGTSQFNVAYTNSENWENEFNDSAKTACALKNNTFKYGTTSNYDKADYFKFTLKKTSKVKFTIGPKEINGSNSYWSVKLFNSKNETYRVFSGTQSVQTSTVYLKKGTYYLMVEGWGTKNVPYKLKYQASAYTVKAPTIKSVKIGKYQTYQGRKYVYKRYLDTISMAKNSGLTAGYTVQVAKDKAMKHRYINEKMKIVSYSDAVTVKAIHYYDWTLKRNLKTSKSTYYVRVRAYILDPFGHEIYSSYSKVKKVTK